MRSDPEAYNLLHKGSLALAQMEANGIRVDMDFLDNAIDSAGKQIKQLQIELEKDEVYRTWKKEFGDRTNLGSRTQMKRIVYGKMGYPCKNKTPTGREQLNKEALQDLDLPFAQKYIKIEELKKLKSTFLGGLRREVYNGYLHPFYNLHTASTFRSSSGSDKDDVNSTVSYNFQNLPIRNQELALLIRNCFIPSPGWHLVEMDFSQLEVRISCAYHKDENLIDYVKNSPPKDMHLDTACDIFLLKPFQVSKKTTRDSSKNQFVFPEFYGSMYFNCAKNIWKAMIRREFKIEGTNTLVIDHLKKQGITELGECDPKVEPREGTFEYHLKQVEHILWHERFSTYHAWKDSYYQKYRKRGWIKTLTGFLIEGLLDKNYVTNAGIQGGAFHCLLKAIIIIQKWLNKNKMQTKLVGQIHDSLIADSPPDEIQDYIGKIHDVMTKVIPRIWSWINVPLDAEAEVTPIDSSWYTKKKWVKNDKGIWMEEVKK